MLSLLNMLKLLPLLIDKLHDSYEIDCLCLFKRLVVRASFSLNEYKYIVGRYNNQ